jgi:hypothetical protein
MATKGKQIITNVYLDPEVYASLKLLSENTGAPMAHYLRKGAERMLEEHGWTREKGFVFGRGRPLPNEPRPRGKK